jgi:hypothetical protein
MLGHGGDGMSAAARHEAAIARREADAIRQARAEENRKRRALKKHGFHLSAYEREDADFYPTPPILVAGLAVGLPQLRIELRRIALDPCAATALSFAAWRHLASRCG